jgi:DNA repair protein RadD
MISLRDDQNIDVAALRGAFAAGFHSPLLVRATGTGKTFIFSYMAGRLVLNGKRVVAMVHRDELVQQISESFSKFDVKHGLIAANTLYDRRILAHVASVMTLARRIDRVAVPDYVIIDEAHHSIAATWGKILAYWRAKNPKLRVIGVTATPELLSGQGLGAQFDEMIVGLQSREGIETGVLAPYRLFAAHQQVDLSNVHMMAGDFNKKELGSAMNKPAIVGSVIGEYSKLLNGAPSVAFCVSVEHAQAVADQFRGAGYRAACVDGKMDKGLRREVMRDFSRGVLNVLTSAELISEGVDVPGLVGAMLLRPTWSLAMYLQQVGRTLRTAPGKEAAIILDHVGNSSRHGMPDDPREWSLLGRDARKGKKKDEDNVACRQCPECYAVSPAAASKCRDCGKPFPIKARKIEEVAGTLSEVEVARMRRQSAREQAAAETLEDLIRIGTQRGFKNAAGWARHVYEARQAKRAG